MRQPRLLLTAGASAATVVLTMGPALADPVPLPVYPPVVGVGAQTTEELFNQICNVNTNFRNPAGSNNPNDRICQSWGVDPQPSNITTRSSGCTIPRPRFGYDGTDKLVRFPACVDFARVVADDSHSNADRLGKNLTYIPMATDALTYAIRIDSDVPADLTNADLKAIYTCDPTIVFNKIHPTVNPDGFQPLLGSFGDENRAYLFRVLGITDAASYTDSGQLGECITDKDSNGIRLAADDGRVLTNPKQLITYSAAPWLAQVFKAAPDIHGASTLGSINGTGPTVAGYSDTYSIRGDSDVPPDLTIDDLKAIYTCDPTITFPSNLVGFKPLLTPFGVGNRMSFLAKLGLIDSANYTTLHPCIHDTLGFGADDGRVLANKQQLVNYDSGPWLSQITKRAPDIHGASILGSINMVNPGTLNGNSFGSRTVYNVIRNSDVPGPGPIHDMFVGTGSKVCQDIADIKRAGFNVLPGTTPAKTCGDTNITTP